MFTQIIIQRLALTMSVALLFSTSATPMALAKSQDKKALERAAKVKTEIAKLGTGKDARIAVKLRDKSTVAGFVSQVGEDSFVITDLKTSATTTVPYLDVEQARGKGLSTGAKIAIGAGVGVGVLFLIWAIICWPQQCA
jgi:hypothetical protein